MDDLNILSIITSFGSLGVALSTKGDYTPIHALNDMFYVRIGRKFSLAAEKARIEDNAYLKKFEEDMQKSLKSVSKECLKISPENIQHPRENIAGPSMSALNDYSGEKHTREMFAKLIASSMDKTKNEIAQQSFVEIVKNMSPIDAAILKELFEDNGGIPIAEIRSIRTDEGYNVEFTNLYLSKNPEYKIATIATSLNNLERLGLVDLSYTRFRKSSDYSIFENMGIFKEIVNKINEENSRYEGLMDSTSSTEQQDMIKTLLNRRVSLQKGIASLKPFGEAFSKVCLSN